MIGKIKLFSFFVLILFIFPTLSPTGFLFAQETENVETFQSDGLISWDQCPYDFEFYLEEGFSKVVLYHVGDDGKYNKFGGWKAWVELNGDKIYEWKDFNSDTGSEWYDHTLDEYFFDKDLNIDSTDITDFASSGENTLTFYHYTEGNGSGILIEAYYPASQGIPGNAAADGDQSGIASNGPQQEVLDTPGGDGLAEKKEYSSEQLILDEQLDLDKSITESSQKISEEEIQKLVFNFKSLYIDMDNPSYVFGRDIPGLSEESLKQYTGSILYSKLMGPAEYLSGSNSWEDIARLALIESKLHYNYSQKLGYFKSLYNILSVFYIVQSFRESITEMPGQFNTLKSVKSAKDIVKHSDTLVSLTSNLSGIYETVISVDKEGARELGFPELDPKVMFVIGAVTSGGWSVLGDISKETFIDNAQYSINYEIKKALLNSSMAYHAQNIHDIAIKEKFSAEEIEQFYFHARRIAVLKQLDVLLNMEDSVSLWQENPDLVTRAFDFLNIIDKESAMEQDLNIYGEILSNYENAEQYLLNDMQGLGLGD